MNIIGAKEIEALGITPATAIEWVREALLMKDRCQLPPKMSVHPRGNDFFTSMPCLLPEEFGRFGCKVVSRIRGAVPALKSEMMLFDSSTGDLLSLVNTDWITTMRTGAMATLAIQTLRNSGASVYSFVGLGATGRCTLECLLAEEHREGMTIRLKRYKNHAEKVVEELAPLFPDVRFEIMDTMEELVRDADVVVSCITDADGLMVEDASLFKPGVLVVPVHTRGFQNCDRVFDKVYADDEGHVRGFRYFSEFRKFGEIGDVLAGRIPGRESDEERILSYNIGLGLHDVLYATKIQAMLGE